MTMPNTNGTYEFRLFANNGYTKLANSGLVTVGTPTDSTPTPAPAPAGAALSVSSSTVKLGQSVTISWSGVASPTGTDWIGLFAQSAPDSSVLNWLFTSTCNKKSGKAKASGSCSMAMPKIAGIYEFRLFANNDYTRLAVSPAITVKK